MTVLGELHLYCFESCGLNISRIILGHKFDMKQVLDCMGTATILLDVTKQQTCLSHPYSTQDSMG